LAAVLGWKPSAIRSTNRKRILSSLRKHVRKPSRVTFAIAAATVTATAAVTAGAAVGSASSASPVARAAARQHSTELASYAALSRPLQVFRAHVALEQVQQIAAEARIAAARAAARAAAQRAAAQRAAARQAAANAAAAQATAAKSTAPSPAAVQPSGSPEQTALAMLGSFGWSSSQFSCLVSLWGRESGWNIYASNPSSGAYGIPQALPGSKMASAGGDWQSDAATQIRWGLGYIQQTYGSPCAAWDHSEADGWY
jgi:hypothetical protein